jgi:hypothetical protein
MVVETINLRSQEFDDSCFFQRLTLIDICCGPPVAGGFDPFLGAHFGPGNLFTFAGV